ncbi:MAG: hypothetical protein M5U14_12140 [Acidimicrobiia bacterium]|nr:hypothetical protein [Acidimicrobiia bacterium]
MPTDPYVPARLEDAPRQQQNLAPGVRLPPARRWRADRPGDLGPGQPAGPLLGSPGPNIGYALTLARRAGDRFQLLPHEHLEDAVSVVAEVAMRRSAAFGRAPVVGDVEFAMALLGYLGDVPHEQVEWREHVVAGAAHEYATRREVVDAVPGELLRLRASELPARLAVIRESLRQTWVRRSEAAAS